MIELMKPNRTLHQSEIQDGDIICFQNEISDQEARGLESEGLYSNPPQFYAFLHNRVTVLFKPKFYEPGADQPEFSLVLNKKQNYDTVGPTHSSALCSANVSDRLFSDCWQGRRTPQARTDEAEVHYHQN